jgi:hypothetical protein
MRQRSGHARALRRVRDPRLLLGIFLVLGSTVVGARVMAAADSTVSYWSLARDVHAGDQLRGDDLVPARAHLPRRAASSHLRTSAELPGDIDSLVWARSLRSGSLLTIDALADKADADRRELPVSVGWGSAPDDLLAGDVVDVWVGPAPGEHSAADAVRVLAAVRVAAVSDGNAAAGGSLARTVVLMVDPDGLGGATMAALTSDHVTLVRVP